jgi:cytochrome c oxidase cbb3-type subunit I/II
VLLGMTDNFGLMCGVFIVFSSYALADSVVQGMTSQQTIRAGREFFANRCSGCHGVEADGNGPAANMLNPKPRNLVSGSFKFRSTPSGVLPTTDDLLRTIEQGVPGTAMPPFRDLPSSEKLSLVMYIRSLRPEFRDTRVDQLSIAISSPPKEIFGSKGDLLKAAKKGIVHYQKACISCHGQHGKGDGPSAEELTDSDNQPIRPANLRLPQLKSGTTAKDLFRAINTGLDGSPMPGFESVFQPKESWELVAYIYYLRGLEAGIYTEKDSLQ